MSLTPQPSPTRVTERICAGIDWASVDHAICILDNQGTVIERFFVVHDAAGLKTLVRRSERERGQVHADVVVGPSLTR